MSNLAMLNEAWAVSLAAHLQEDHGRFPILEIVQLN
jgi:hypothetical protein